MAARQPENSGVRFSQELILLDLNNPDEIRRFPFSHRRVTFLKRMDFDWCRDFLMPSPGRVIARRLEQEDSTELVLLDFEESLEGWLDI